MVMKQESEIWKKSWQLKLEKCKIPMVTWRRCTNKKSTITKNKFQTSNLNFPKPKKRSNLLNPKSKSYKTNLNLSAKTKYKCDNRSKN